MNNDLISREALKKALTEAHINMTLTFDIATFNCVMNTIDNAPAIEDRTREVLSLQETIRKLTETRPQGETNAEIFQQTFGIYATELWSMKEADFLKWLNAEQD